MKFKKLLCRIFGHRLNGAEWYESYEYVTMDNCGKKVVRTFRKCKRCGAMIMVGKYKKNR